MLTYSQRLTSAMGSSSAQTKQMADSLGLTRQAITKVVEGKSKAFSVENHFAVADYLKVSPRWLATGEGSMRVDPVGPVRLEDALPVVLDAISRIPPIRWDSVSKMMEKVVSDPASREDVVEELARMLEPPPNRAAA
jgi:hypothetical protein